MSTTSKKIPEPEERPLRQQRPQEASFTLLETVLALGLMVTIVLEASFIQGKAITFGDYNQKVTQATWLAKAVLEKIEWGAKFYDFKEVKADFKEAPFPEEMCPPYNNEGCIYKYNLSIQEFKLPILDMIAGQLGGGKDEEGEDSGGGFGSIIEKTIKQFLGDEILKIAHVEVTWPDGSKKDSVELAYVITNQRQLDTQVFGQPPIGGVQNTKPEDTKDQKKKEEEQKKS